MMMLTVSRVVMMAVATISAAFGLKRGLHRYQMRSETTQHPLDHMVRPDTKNLVSNFGRQMTVSKMPGKAHKLIGVFMSCLNDELSSGLNLQPPPILELQAVSISHRDSFPKVEKDVFTLIRTQANASAMPRVKIDSESALSLFIRPIPGGAMNGNVMHRHIST